MCAGVFLCVFVFLRQCLCFGLCVVFAGVRVDIFGFVYMCVVFLWDIACVCVCVYPGVCDFLFVSVPTRV